MSTIQLSDELLNDIQNVLAKHDPATEDAGISIQYLAALTGFILSQFPNHSLDEKKNILQHLHDFSLHVLTDSVQEEKQPENNAFGVWKPE